MAVVEYRVEDGGRKNGRGLGGGRDETKQVWAGVVELKVPCRVRLGFLAGKADR